MTFARARKIGGTMALASFRLSTSTMIHPLCSPSKHPQSAWVKKWEPVLKKASTARAQATCSASCSTSIRNLGIVYCLHCNGHAPSLRAGQGEIACCLTVGDSVDERVGK